jgi:hypothetical protein
MKVLLNKLSAVKKHLTELIEKRDETFDSRSEAWHETDAADEWIETSIRLEEMNEAITEWIDELQ